MSSPIDEPTLVTVLVAGGVLILPLRSKASKIAAKILATSGPPAAIRVLGDHYRVLQGLLCVPWTSKLGIPVVSLSDNSGLRGPHRLLETCDSPMLGYREMLLTAVVALTMSPADAATLDGTPANCRPLRQGRGLLQAKGPPSLSTPTASSNASVAEAQQTDSSRSGSSGGGSSIGTSTQSPADWPVPAGYRRLRLHTFRHVGDGVIKKRLQLEHGWRDYVEKRIDLLSAGTMRLLNYTTHPSSTPGLEALECIDETVVTFLKDTLGASDFIHNDQNIDDAMVHIQAHLADNGVENVTMEQLVLTPAQSPEDNLRDGFTSASDVNSLLVASKCRLLLSGDGLLPAAADKQTAFLLAVQSLVRQFTLTAYSFNVSSWEASPADNTSGILPSGGSGDVAAEVWLQARAAGFSPARFWQQVLQGLPVETARRGIRMQGTFQNASTFYTTVNGTAVGVASFPPSASDTIGPSAIPISPPRRNGIDAGTLAVTIALVLVLGLALLLACIVASICFRMRKRKQQEAQVSALPAAVRRELPWLDLQVAEARAAAAFPALLAATVPLSVGGTITGSSCIKSNSTCLIEGSQLMSSSVSSGGDSDMSVVDLAAVEGDINPASISFCVDAATGSRVLLGSGSFSKVYLGERRGGQAVAIKLLHSARRGSPVMGLLQREVALLRSVSYDRNVVQFYGYCCAAGGDSAMLVMEHCGGGNLRRLLSNERCRKHYTWTGKGRRVALDVARGLHHIHRCHVVHRDLKASNVLLTTAGAAKVSDVGLAQSLLTALQGGRAAGTFPYLAPEVLHGRTPPDHETATKADVYSFGVLLWEIITAELPRRGQMRAVSIGSECSAGAAALIESCMATDVESRPTSRQVVRALEGLQADPVAATAAADGWREESGRLDSAGFKAHSAPGNQSSGATSAAELPAGSPAAANAAETDPPACNDPAVGAALTEPPADEAPAVAAPR